MFKPLISRFLQHITNQNNWSREYLTKFAGKVVLFDVAFIQTSLLILDDGSLSVAGETAEPDASVHIPPSLLIRLIANDDAAKMQIKIDGDVDLATELGKTLRLMQWDVEEDLSHLIGDIPTDKLAGFGKKAFTETKKQAINITEMLSEYWQEENPTIAKKRHVEQFISEVDTLRSDVARFEKRLAKLDKKLQESSEL